MAFEIGACHVVYLCGLKFLKISTKLYLLHRLDNSLEPTWPKCGLAHFPILSYLVFQIQLKSPPKIEFLLVTKYIDILLQNFFLSVSLFRAYIFINLNGIEFICKSIEKKTSIHISVKFLTF